MVRETRIRSLIKAVSWRITGTLATTLIVYFLSKKWVIAISVGAFEFLSKIALYFFHERMWEAIPFGRKEVQPSVIWLTGLSGAGKSSLGEQITKRIKAAGYYVEHLDGDTVRSIFPETGFSRSERELHIKRIGYLCSRLQNNGVFVIASFISPYRESRDFVRQICSSFAEIYVSTPLEECQRRDPKGLYARVKAGALKNFTGVDDPYEKPVSPELELDTTNMTIEASVQLICDRLCGKQLPNLKPKR